MPTALDSLTHRCSPLAALLLQLSGCATTAEQAARQDVLSREKASSSLPGTVLAEGPHNDPPSPPNSTASHRQKPEKKRFSGGLQYYIAQAMQHSPELRASFQRWQASVHRISRSRRLPDPTISFGYFVQSVETRVGPQRAKLSLKQSFPWPTRLTAGADAASAQARAQEKRFDALTLVVTRKVSDVYWRLWLLREKRKIHAEHLKVVRSLSGSARARVATGTTTLADLQQIDLTAARLEDLLRGMDEEEISAEASLRAAIGSIAAKKMPSPDQPPEVLAPHDSRDTLQSYVRKHPLIESYRLLALAQDERARAEDAVGLPSFTLGADWIITGKSTMPDVEDSGKDAIVVGAGMSIPLWRGSYDDSVHAAEAEASAQRFEQQAALNRATAELDSSLAAVRNAARRVKLYRHTLVPQADSAYASVLGAYATGRGTVAQTLLAQSALLSLRDELEEARAEYAQSWARLEQVVGREVRGELAAESPKNSLNKPIKSAPIAAPATQEEQTHPASQVENNNEG